MGTLQNTNKGTLQNSSVLPKQNMGTLRHTNMGTLQNIHVAKSSSVKCLFCAKETRKSGVFYRMGWQRQVGPEMSRSLLQKSPMFVGLFYKRDLEIRDILPHSVSTVSRLPK